MPKYLWIPPSFVVLVTFLLAISMFYIQGRFDGMNWQRRMARYHELRYQDKLRDSEKIEFQELSKEFGK